MIKNRQSLLKSNLKNEELDQLSSFDQELCKENSQDNKLNQRFQINQQNNKDRYYRWNRIRKQKIQKGPWNKQQDEILINLIRIYGAKNWSKIAKFIPGRMGKQCRERWFNHLDPNINKKKWTQEEDEMIIQAHEKYGNRWSLISKYLNGRTDNSVKNHWNSTIKRKLKKNQYDSNITLKDNEQTYNIKPKALFQDQIEIKLNSQELLKQLFSHFK